VVDNLLKTLLEISLLILLSCLLLPDTRKLRHKISA